MPGTPPRSGPWVVVALGVAVVAFLAVAAIGFTTMRGRGSDSAETAERTYPSAWDERVAPIAAWVADERDLEFAHPVEVVFQTEEEYLADAAGDPTAATEDEQREMDDFVAVLRALGLVQGEVDLAGAMSDLSSEGTLAYYDPEREVVFVRGDELTPSVRVTVAHELTHVLQDQHFDLGRLADPEYEAYDGLRAMAEGDAGRIEDAYAEEVLTPEERIAEAEESDAGQDESAPALEGVPPVLSIIFGAPYVLGEGFLTYREQVDGGQPWDAVLEDPPSAEELLDPAAWDTPRSEVAAVEVSAPEDAEVLDENTFDPLTWYLLLASRGEPADALEVVDGWGGDAYVSYREGGRVCAAMAVIGDDAAATDAFHAALRTWADADPTGSARVERVGDEVEVRACDPGPDAAAAGTVTEDLMALPAFRAGVESELVGQGATQDQARCTSRALMAVVSPEQLTASTPDPAIQQQAAEAVATCA